MISRPTERLKMFSGASWSPGRPGQLRMGVAGMPLKPPSGASPMFHCSPAVWLMKRKKISETVSVITPR